MTLPPPPPDWTSPGTAPGARANARPQSRFGIAAGALAVLLGAAAGILGYWVFERGRIEVVNGMAGPVTVAMPGVPRLRIEPGEYRVIRLRRGKPSTLEWTVLPSSLRLNASDFDSDKTLTGHLNVPELRSQLHSSRLVISTVSSEAAPMAPGWTNVAPLITNKTTDSLEIEIIVNAGGDALSSVPCGCRIPPGATRAFIGYFAVDENFTVRATTKDARSAMFSGLSPSQSDSLSGALPLKFVQANLRRNEPDPVRASIDRSAKEAACRESGGVVMDTGGGAWQCEHMSLPSK